MKGKLNFKLNKALKVKNFIIPYDPQLPNLKNKIFDSTMRKGSKFKSIIKTIICQEVFLRNYLLVDGFIKREVGKLVKKFLIHNTVFLDIGCGDLSLVRFLPRNLWYNAIDISLSEFHLKRVLNRRERINVALASATSIPLDSNSISLAVSTEVLEHIQDIDKALSEIYRILKPGGIFIISIPNNYCYKYQKKGPHPEHINNWTFKQFKEYMIHKGFIYLEGYMRGFWIPLTILPGKASYQLPISSKNEFYNTNFFFVFKKRRDT